MNHTKILLVSSSPKNKNLLRTNKEFSIIKEELDVRAEYRECFNITVSGALTLKGFLDLLLRKNPHLVHFSGHGDLNEIYFEDENGSSVAIKVDELVEFFASLKAEIQCVVFNACQSDQLAKKVSDYIPYSIGIKHSIEDQQALNFSESFYRSIGAGKSIKEAFDIGKAFAKSYYEPMLYQQNNQTEQPFIQLPCYGGLDEEKLKQQFKRFSGQLLSWSTTLGKNQSYLRQPELQKLIDLIEKKESSVTVLLGQAGCGKTTLLTKLGLYFDKKNITLLAIKADQLPATIDNIKQIFNVTDPLPEPADSCLKIMAKNGKTLLLLDQVDALADLSDLRTERLNRVLDLVYSLQKTANLHLVISCREFEFKHDSRLRGLDKQDSMVLALPYWQDICVILKQSGMELAKIETFPKEVKDELLIPQYLKTYLAVYDPPQLDYFASYQLMLQKLWENKVLIKKDCEQFINHIAATMGKKEEYWLPLLDFSKNTHEINELVASNILVKDSVQTKFSFYHQTYFDFAHARNFLIQKNSLFDYIKSHQNSLFLRPKLWQIIHYLRNAEPTLYDQELDKILKFKTLRVHVKQLLIEFIGQVSQPRRIEQQWVHQLLETQHCNRMLYAMVGQDNWFIYLEKICLVDLIQRLPDDLPALSSLLKEAPSQFHTQIAQLLQTHWLNCKNYDESILWVLETIHQNNPLSFDIVSNIISRNLDIRISQFLEKALPFDNQRGFKLLEQYLDLKLSKATKDDKIKDLFNYNSPYELKLYWLRKHQNNLIKNYPLDFLKVTLNWLNKVLDENTPTQDYSIHGTHYNKTNIVLTLPQDQYAQYSILHAMDEAIEILAQQTPEKYKEIVELYKNNDWYIIQRLLARGNCYLVTVDANYVLNFLIADPRRFYLGSDNTFFKETVLSIKKLSLYLQKNKINQLINSIKKYSFYNHKSDSVEQKQIRIRIDREHRLTLYSSIPENLQPVSLKKLIAEEKRALPDYNILGNRINFELKEISHISLNNMKKASIPELLKLFLDIPDSCEWVHPQDWDKSGAVDLSRKFGEMSKLMPQKAIDIIKQLPETHQLYISEALNGISESNYLCSELYALITQLVKKGFKSQKYFQFNLLNALEHCLKKREKPPQEILDILMDWLETNSKNSQENNNNLNQKQEGSLLWSTENTLVSIPELILLQQCIYYICWFEKPFKKAIWFKSLKIHLANKEHWETWLLLFPYLRVDNQQETEDFLIELFLTYPQFLEHKVSLQFLASSLGWISDTTMDRWLMQLKNKPSKLSQQAYGELLMIRYLRFPDNPKYLQSILQYVPSRKLYYQQAKLAWSDIFLYEIKLLFLKSKQWFKKQTDTNNIEMGCAYSLVYYWFKRKPNDLITDTLLKQYLKHQSKQVKQASREVYHEMAFKKDMLINESEWSLLTILVHDFDNLKTDSLDFLFKRLEKNIPQKPEIVIKLMDCFLSDLENPNTKNHCLIGKELTAISHGLQRLSKYRSQGLDLFEKLIDLNLYGVNKIVEDIDRYRTMVK